MHEMAKGLPPYIAGNQIALADKICNRPPPPLPARCSSLLRWLTNACLEKNPLQRPSSLECFQVASSCCCMPVRQYIVCALDGSKENNSASGNTAVQQQLEQAQSKLGSQAAEIAQLKAAMVAPRCGIASWLPSELASHACASMHVLFT